MRNGQGPPLPFMVDTGTTYPLLLDKQTAIRLKLKPNDEQSILNGTVQMKGVTVDSLELVGTKSTDYVVHYSLVGPARTAFLVDMEPFP